MYKKLANLVRSECNIIKWTVWVIFWRGSLGGGEGVDQIKKQFKDSKLFAPISRWGGGSQKKMLENVLWKVLLKHTTAHNFVAISHVYVGEGRSPQECEVCLIEGYVKPQSTLVDELELQDLAKRPCTI